MIEEFWEGDARRFLVARTFDGFEHPTFKPGVVLTFWNGVPIERAVELNADRQAGSNEDARLARGIEAMTIRPLAQSAPPDEHWAVVGYTDGGEEQSLVIEWRVFEPDPSPEGVDPTDAEPARRAEPRHRRQDRGRPPREEDAVRGEGDGGRAGERFAGRTTST